MQPNVYKYLENREDLIKFIRMNPIWYRRLTRYPDQLEQLEKEAKYFYGKTTPQKLDRITNQMQMLNMFLQMAQAMQQ